MKKYIPCLLILLYLCACRTVPVPGELNPHTATSVLQEADVYAGPETRLFNPFLIVSAYADFHLIAWFTGHDEFVSAEAFVYNAQKIQAILTRHDNSQVEYVNYEIDAAAATAIGRERYTTDISFFVSTAGENARLRVTLQSGDRLEIDYRGHGAPDTRYGGVTDVGAHAPDGGFPVFYRAASSVGRDGSAVRIGSVDYLVPRDDEISVPPFFTATRAYLSRDCQSFILPTHTALTTHFLTSDAADKAGLVVGENNGVTEISAVKATWPGSAAASGPPQISFEPALQNPLALKERCSVRSKFTVHFSGQSTPPVSGNVIMEKHNDRVRIVLHVDSPDWAKGKRDMEYEIMLQHDEAVVSAMMLKIP